MKQKNFWALDWLRFLLALYLVLYHTLRGHYRPIADTWIEALLELGNMATTVFFVLSGFLLTHVYVILRNGHKVNKRNFLIGRFSSLIPLHIATFLFALIPFFFTIYARGGIGVPVEPSGSAIRMMGNKEALFAVFMNLTLLSAWNPYYLVLNSPSWSLSALMCYYVLFPFIVQRFYKMRSPGYGLLILGLLFVVPGAIADLLQRNDLFTDGLLHHNPVIRLPLFLSGVVLCILYSRHRKSESDAKYIAISAGIIVATLLGAIYLVFNDLRPHLLKNGLYFPAALGLVWICACTEATARENVVRWGARLGAASLPMFLIHVPLFQLFTKAEKFIMSAITSPTVNYSSMISSSHGIEQAIIFYPLYIVPLIALCILVQERFVVPTREKIKLHFVNRSAPLTRTTILS